ncbi:MAG: hypothetical protein ACQEWF_22525 [Bacillota bacterium]
MDPVIGLEIAKGESQVQAFMARKHPFGKTVKFKHDTKQNNLPNSVFGR